LVKHKLRYFNDTLVVSVPPLKVLVTKIYI